MFDSLVQYIIEKTPKIDIPWITVWNGPWTDKEKLKNVHSSSCEQAVKDLTEERSIEPAKSNTEGPSVTEVVTKMPVVEDTEEKSGEVCSHIRTQEVGQSALKRSRTDSEETKRPKLQDVSIEYQKLNIKTLVCKQGKKKKVNISVKEKKIPSAEYKRMLLDSSDDELQQTKLK